MSAAFSLYFYPCGLSGLAAVEQLHEACQGYDNWLRLAFALSDGLGEAGRQIFVNRLAAEKGAEVEFATVLLIDNDGDVKVGAPYIEGAKVKATVLDDSCKGDKVLVFKKRRRKGYQKCNGHRQYLSKIQIEEIA